MRNMWHCGDLPCLGLRPTVRHIRHCAQYTSESFKVRALEDVIDSRDGITRLVSRPCMGPSKSSDLFHAFSTSSTSFIPVSLFDLESRFFAPTHTCWRPSLWPGGTLSRLQAAP